MKRELQGKEGYVTWRENLTAAFKYQIISQFL